MRKVIVCNIMSFSGKAEVSLRLVDTRRRDDSDNVVVQYEVRHENNQ